MPDLQQIEWEKINEIVSKISHINDLTLFRKVFLKELKSLVYFDLADFCLSNLNENKAVSLIDPVVVSRYSENFVALFNLKYEKYFEQLDYTRWVFSNSESIVYKESDIINSEARLKSSYYIDYLKPLNLINVAGISLTDNGVHLGAVNLYRTGQKEDYNERDLYILRQFLPHLKKMLLINHKTAIESMDKYSKLASILKREYNLTNREIEIIVLVAAGNDNQEISKNLSITIGTVKKHLGNIFNKLQVENKFQLLHFLIKNDIDLFE